jgi:CRISPR-associated endonuclease Csn1
LKIVEVTADEPQRGKSDIWYSLILENGWIYDDQVKRLCLIGKIKPEILL